VFAFLFTESGDIIIFIPKEKTMKKILLLFTFSLAIMLLTAQNSPVVFEELTETHEVFETIKTRRSIREFETRDVSNDTIELLIRAAQWAPSSRNTQTWRFIVVKDHTKRTKIAKAAFKKYDDGSGDYEATKKYLGMEAPVQVFVFNDTLRSANPSGDAIGCYAATQNLLLAAKDLGLGTCWQAMPMAAGTVIDKMLNVPEHFDLVATVALGYPAEHPKTKARKHKLEEILWFENYQPE
jgi:nitroreductase